MTHKLNEDPSYPPVKQKKRKQGSFKNQVIQDKMQTLLKIGSIHEVKYPNWLANTVVVPKKNGKWRVCVDYTDLKNVCPKDSFPLPHIDQLIDATAGHELLSFLDAYLGYNQIKMDPLDEEKTSFITDKGTYCYKVMPFGLKNAGATYQRLVTKMFQEQLGKTMEVYIDDMLVKSQQVGDHIQHMSDTFQILRKFNMKLNPEKCAFSVSSALKKQDQIEWSEECQQALKNLKVYLSNPPLLAKPKDGEKLLIYLAISEVAVSVILVREDQGACLGIVLVPHTGETIRLAIKCHSVTNNEAKYEAVIAGLELARELSVEQVAIKSDLQLIVNQIMGTYTIPREENVEVDALANLASVAEVTNDENASYGIVPEDKKQAQAFCKKAARYCLKQGNLYRKMFGGPLARCLGPSQTEITSTPYNLVGNGQAESTNKVIINNLKKRLEESKGNCPEVLPGVLWAYRTTTKISTGETPFSLVYGAEALIQVEIVEPRKRYTQATEESNEEEMRINLDLLEERREAELIRMAAQK
ncbi:uncharacterized protein [Nicotiana sylvestris]|uniref:uncharacterized protein n=1 Tax=Nicotiana sylvestris TaxID=4096 RepID=UPI00388C6BEB